MIDSKLGEVLKIRQEHLIKFIDGKFNPPSKAPNTGTITSYAYAGSRQIPVSTKIACTQMRVKNNETLVQESRQKETRQRCDNPWQK